MFPAKMSVSDVFSHIAFQYTTKEHAALHRLSFFFSLQTQATMLHPKRNITCAGASVTTRDVKII